MTMVDVTALSYAYGRTNALRNVSFTVPEGALYALLGPNGSGKTTLLQILSGLRRATAGQAHVMGTDSHSLTLRQRGEIGYIAEGQPLPRWMRLEQLEAYLAPLYPTWDRALARELRDRFDLDPARRVGTLSRGEHMKAALLVALAPRPRLLVMDEPFTGMDALVKDDLVRGLLASAGNEGWTVLLCSHDIGELELLADWVGFLDRGEMRLSEPIDVLRERFKRVTVVTDSDVAITTAADPGWMSLERAGRRVSFLVSHAEGAGLEERIVRERFPQAEGVDVSGASLREVFVALARQSRDGRAQRSVA